MTWAYVEGTSVAEEHFKLPLYWKNYSNFFALEGDVDYLRSIGWYRLVENTTPITDDHLEYYGEPEYQILHDEGIVIKTEPVLIRDNPFSEEDRFFHIREQFMNELRQRRNQLLGESDWTQMLDVQLSKSEQWIESWRDYRQQLRDLPLVYNQHPYDTATDLNAVQWPSVPVMN